MLLEAFAVVMTLVGRWVVSFILIVHMCTHTGSDMMRQLTTVVPLGDRKILCHCMVIRVESLLPVRLPTAYLTEHYILKALTRDGLVVWTVGVLTSIGSGRM